MHSVHLALDQRVDVIGHQAVSVKKERQALLLIFQQRKELLIVPIGAEDSLALIPSDDHVIQTTLKFNSCLPCHAPLIGFLLTPPVKKNRRIAGLTPSCF